MFHHDHKNSDRHESDNQIDKHHHHHHHRHSKKRPSTEPNHKRSRKNKEEEYQSNVSKSDLYRDNFWNDHISKEQDSHDRHILESYSEYRNTPHGSTKLV